MFLVLLKRIFKEESKKNKLSFLVFGWILEDNINLNGSFDRVEYFHSPLVMKTILLSPCRFALNFFALVHSIL
jgi:hypothetical protein